jgi:alpha-glucosidase
VDASRYAAGLPLRSWEAGEPGAAHLAFEGAVAEIAIAEDGSVRLRAAFGASLPPDPGPAVGREPWRPADVRPAAREGGGLRIDCDGPLGSAHVEVEPDPFALRILDRRGELVAEIRDLSLAPDGSARCALTTEPGERFFGFGERAGGLDKRGERVLLRNRDPEAGFANPLYVSIPFFVGLRRGAGGARARGVLLDAFAPSHFDVAATAEDRVGLETTGGGLDLAVFPGPEPRHVLERFTNRVGRSPLPPLWALGHHQSRWSYGSEKEVLALAREIRSRGIPTDVIHLDIDYMDGYRVFTWNAKRFPDPAGLLRDLAHQGFRVVTIIDPGVKVDSEYRVYREGRERGLFCENQDGSEFSLRVWPGGAALPDFNRAEVQAWWGEQHRGLLAAGVAGIWMDMNEPAGWAKDVRAGRAILPYRKQNLSRVVQRDPADEERRVPHESVRNLYGHQQCRATRGFLERADPDRRPFLLTRSGHAGIQRSAAVWTGDNRSRWSHLRQSIPMLLNLSLSGVPLCGSDIGGFFFSCTPELYARWIQLGALYPFARTHTVWFSRRQEPWRFGRRVEGIARHALALRMRLLPYLYGLFREAERSGAPVWRPLFYEFPDDPDAAGVEDQLMLGPSLLAAPVVERGARERDVYLPPGVWMSWDDDARYVGPRRLRVAAPLERSPLFARGGSVIPTHSPIRHVGEAPEEPCVLEVFPGAGSRAELFEDDGESNDYRDGAFARTPLRLWDRAGGRLRLEIGRREGSYEVPPRRLRIAVHGCPPPDAVRADGAALSEHTDAPGYRFEEGRVHVRLLDRGEGHTVEIEPAP